MFHWLVTSKMVVEVIDKPFLFISQLDHAVKIRSIPLTQDRYNEAAVILQELMALMP